MQKINSNPTGEPRYGQNDKREVSLLLENDADADIQDNNGKTALMQAAISYNVKAVPVLLENNATVDIQDKNGWTVLMFAAKYGCTEIVL